MVAGELRTRGGATIRALRWPAVLFGALATVVLGLWGFSLYFETSSEQGTFSDTAYLTLQLFTINIGILESPVPWQIQVAKWTGAAVAIALGVGALTALFRDQFDRLRLRAWPPQAVVFGLGACGSLLAQSFAREGYRVVAVERDGIPAVDECRRAGVIVVAGDATDTSLVEALGLRHAELALVVCGDETVNSEVALRIGEYLTSQATRRSSDPLQCFVHIDDSDLCNLLRRSGALGPSNQSLLTLEFFNPSALAAPAMFEHRRSPVVSQVAEDDDPVVEPTDLEPHRLIVGLGQMGGQLLLHMARTWWFGSPPGSSAPPLHLTVIDRNVDDALARLRIEEPDLEPPYCHLHAEQMDVLDSAFFTGSFLLGTDEVPPVTDIYICLDDDVRALTAALALREQLRTHGMTAPIVVRMFHNEGLASALDRLPDPSGLRLESFTLADWSCRPEILRDLTGELVARAAHADYVLESERSGHTPTTKPAMRPWDELSDFWRDSNRDYAHDIDRKLDAVDCVRHRLDGWDGEIAVFTPDEIDILARLEHERWMRFHFEHGWKAGPRDDARKIHSDLVPWDDLSEESKDYDRIFVARIPRFLLHAGFLVERRLDVMSRFVHDAYCRRRKLEGIVDGASIEPWHRLDPALKDANRHQAASIEASLGRLGLRVTSIANCPPSQRVTELTPEQVEQLAPDEHRRFVEQRTSDGWTLGEEVDVEHRRTPDLVDWEELSPAERQLDLEAIRAWPLVLASVGAAIMAVTATPPPNPGSTG